MSDVENNQESDAIVSDSPESPTGSPPDRSDDDAKTGVGSASEQPDASEASSDHGSASEQPDASEASPDHGSASEQPDASEASQKAQPDASEASQQTRHSRKSREGFVVSSSMDKTVVIAVIERVRHPKYNKFVLQTKRLYAHDENNDINVGDKVRVMETRPLSKQKRWRVTDVLERAK